VLTINTLTLTLQLRVARKVHTSVRVEQRRFAYAGLQGALETYLLAETERLARHYNALVALLVAERGHVPDCLARPRDPSQGPPEMAFLEAL
jgi:hypothetical protein